MERLLITVLDTILNHGRGSSGRIIISFPFEEHLRQTLEAVREGDTTLSTEKMEEIIRTFKGS